MRDGLMALNEMRNKEAHGVREFNFPSEKLGAMQAALPDDRVAEIKHNATVVSDMSRDVGEFAFTALEIYMRLLLVVDKTISQA